MALSEKYSRFKNYQLHHCLSYDYLFNTIKIVLITFLFLLPHREKFLCLRSCLGRLFYVITSQCLRRNLFFQFCQHCKESPLFRNWKTSFLFSLRKNRPLHAIEKLTKKVQRLSSSWFDDHVTSFPFKWTYFYGAIDKRVNDHWKSINSRFF